MTVEERCRELVSGRDVHAVEIVYEPPGLGEPWKVSVRRRRPVHLTQAVGRTLGEALDRVEMLERAPQVRP